ncbi:hypothetical protein [Mycoplasma enhydrae]|uniref:hypothetical protein n=1 Tax=Mycoplasma enhydrae TaxID=2499220 RepID=UPI00197B8313|nr:hypothetical protein [Mycoplasma enhydrae]MBN4089699.1 hypothetical protein [Mycoplasma enhydrae]
MTKAKLIEYMNPEDVSIFEIPFDDLKTKTLKLASTNDYNVAKQYWTKLKELNYWVSSLGHEEIISEYLNKNETNLEDINKLIKMYEDIENCDWFSLYPEKVKEFWPWNSIETVDDLKAKWDDDLKENGIESTYLDEASEYLYRFSDGVKYVKWVDGKYEDAFYDIVEQEAEYIENVLKELIESKDKKILNKR